MDILAIQTIHNGYLVSFLMADGRGWERDTARFFGNFESLSEWLSKNLKEPPREE